MRYTIKDIAEELGVSITTVSLIINNRPCRISEETRKKVWDLVKKYNYTPNSNARALVTKKTQTIGLIVPDISNDFFSELAKGVERAAQKQEYSVVFCSSDNKGKKDLTNAALLISKQIDGLILAPSLGNTDVADIAEFNDLVQRNNLPVVLADRTIPFCSYNCVQSNNRQGGYMATNYLLSLGHHKIGCITGPMDVDSARERHQGYTDALQMANTSIDTSLIVTGDYQIESGAACAAALISRGATAIFACNDMMALGAMREIRKQKLKLPTDISLIGFDDITVCELLDPPLSTIHQPLYEVGKTAFQLMAKLIEKPTSKIENTMLSPQLMQRGTTGPPSGGSL